MDRVAIYVRLSEEDRNKQFETDESESIQNQKTMLIQYALEKGWEIYDIYSDDDYAGADRNRPGFKKLLEEAELRKFNIVLCKTQSRFTRELELVEKYIHGLFPIWGIRFISIVDNADTSVRGNKKSRQINGLVNEWYLEDLSDNIKTTLTARRQKGFHIGSFPLYGYKKDPDRKGHLIIDEQSASIVREVFTLFVQGYGKTSIARILNDRGIPNPTEYQRIQGIKKQKTAKPQSTLWKYTAIGKMLANEMYIGNMVQGKYESESYKTRINRPRPKDQWIIVKGTHEPIIDADLWNRVENLLKQKAKPFKIGKIGIFARKARCKSCGYILRTCKQTDGRYYLQCPNRHVAKDACVGCFISVIRLERYVLDELKRLSAQYLDKDELERKVEFQSALIEQKGSLLNEIALHKKRSEQYSKGIQDLYLDKVNGIVSESDYVEMSLIFTENRERSRQRITECQTKLEALESRIDAGDNRRHIIEQYTNLEQLNREIVDKLIDFIVVDKRIPGTREVPIEIHWNF